MGKHRVETATAGRIGRHRRPSAPRRRLAGVTIGIVLALLGPVTACGVSGPDPVAASLAASAEPDIRGSSVSVTANVWTALPNGIHTATGPVWVEMHGKFSVSGVQSGDRIQVRLSLGTFKQYMADSVVGSSPWAVSTGTETHALNPGAGIGFEIRVSRAATVSARLTWVESPREVAGPTSSVSPTVIPTPPTSGPPSPSASPTPTPDPNVWPNPGNTGVPVGTVLTDWPAGEGNTLEPGIYDGYRFPETMTVSTAGNVTIRNSHLLQGINNHADGSGGRGFTIEDSTLGSPTGCFGNFTLGTTDFTARRVEVYGDDGIRITERGWSTGDPQPLIEDSYVRPCNASPDSHSDGLQANGTNGPATVRRNTFDMRNAAAYTAGLFWENSYRGATVVDNLFIGQGPSDYFGTVFGGTTGPLHTVQGNLYADYGNYNRNDQCGNVNWGNNNRRATVNSNYEVTPGAVVSC